MSSPKKNKTEKRLETLAVKTKEQKQAFLEQLPKYPIVQVACEKSGIGRSTYYAWRKSDKAFAKLADEEITSGTHFINDMAESKLIQNIQSGNNTAIIFWLKNHHKQYSERIRHEHEFIEEELTSEQKIAIAKALFNAGQLTSFGRNSMIRKAGGTPLPFNAEEEKMMEDTLREAEVRVIASRKETEERNAVKPNEETEKPEKMVNINEMLRKIEAKKKQAIVVQPPQRRPIKNGVNINSMEYKKRFGKL